MSRKYKFRKSEAAYFVSFTVSNRVGPDSHREAVLGIILETRRY